MKHPYQKYFFWFSLLFVFHMQGQTDSLFKKKDTLIRLDKPVMKFYDFSILPDYFQMQDSTGKTITDSLYKVDYVKAKIVLKDSTLLHRTYKISFLTYPEYWIYPQGKILSVRKREEPEFPSPDHTNRQTDFFDGLKTDGFLSRGVISGNNMNTSPVSKLDLKIKGKLTDQVRLDISIFDDNAPYGYEGVTTTFKDINRIYMRMSAENWNIHAGDTTWQYTSPLFVMKRDNKGAGMEWTTERTKFRMQAAVVKGKFAENRFYLIKGNYGPFPLSVKGKHMVFIIPHSEEVYLNDKKLIPGKDYKIIHETAEIILLPSVEINTHDLLVIKFNYANRSYQRWASWQTFSTGFGSHEIEIFHFNETDSKFKPLLFVLDSNTVRALRQAENGEPPHILSAIPSEFDSDKVLYRKIRTGGDFYFEFAPHPTQDTLYEVHFNYAGKNLGDYVLDRYVAQGPVMRYVGTGNGDYTPYFVPPAPQNNHFTGFAWKFQNEKWQLETNHVFNAYAPNTFVRNQKFKHGLASRIKADYAIKNDSLWKWNYFIQWQKLPAEYHLSDPVFTNGFIDSWQLDPAYLKNNLEYFFTGSHFKKKSTEWAIEFRRLRLPGTALFNQIHWQHQWQSNKLFWASTNYATTGNYKLSAWKFRHFDHRFSYDIKNGKLGLDLNYKKISKQQSGRFEKNSFGFFRIKNYIEKTTENTAWKAGWQILSTDSIKDNHFERVSFERSIFAQIRTGTEKNFLGFRMDIMSDTYRPGQKHWNLLIEGRHAQKNQIYDLHWKAARFGSMIPKSEVIYKRVPDGQGQFQWIDYNGNGIAEPEEFEPAYYSDQADYIRVILPSKNYEPALNNEIGFSFVFKPEKITQASPFIKNWNYRIVTDISNQTPRKIDWKEQILPGNQTLHGRYQVKQWLYYRFSKNWKASYRFTLTGKTENLYNGLIKNFSRNHIWKLLWKWNDQWKLQPEYTQRYFSYYSAYYPAKNYGISTMGYEIPLIYRSKPWFFQLSLAHYKKSSASNLLNQTTYGLRGDYTVKKGKASIKIQLIDNKFSGQSFSPAGFVMLEGLTPGKNFITDLNASIILQKNIRLNLFYQFRKPESSSAIHVANLNLTVRF